MYEIWAAKLAFDQVMQLIDERYLIEAKAYVTDVAKMSKTADAAKRRTVAGRERAYSRGGTPGS